MRIVDEAIQDGVGVSGVANDLMPGRRGAREARAGIGSWMTFYNFRRPHQAMNNQMPMAVWRAGMDKIEAAARAVDMPLRLDNANALPTYPQQKQQEAAGFLKDKGRRDHTLNPTSRGPTNGVQSPRPYGRHPCTLPSSQSIPDAPPSSRLKAWGLRIPYRGL